MSIFSQLKRVTDLSKDDDAALRDEVVDGVRTIEFPPTEIYGGPSRPGDPDYVEPGSTPAPWENPAATAPILSPPPAPRYPLGEEPLEINMPPTTIYGSPPDTDADPDVARAAARAAGFAGAAWDWAR